MSLKLKELSNQKNEIKNNVKEIDKNRSYSLTKIEKKFKISDFVEVTDINTSSPVSPINLSYDVKYINKLLGSYNSNNFYLYGINKDNYLYIFDLKTKNFSKKKILEIEDISDSFSTDYQYDGTILYNTLDGLFILTGKKTDILYHYNTKYETINKICKFEYGHDNGNLLLDQEYNRLFVLGGKKTTKCEYYSFKEKEIYSIPDLTIDRANASFIICKNKIDGFFGFSYKNNKYCGTIEFIDNKNLDEWSEIKNIKLLNEKINLELKSFATINYKEDKNKILIYSGIKGVNEESIIDNFYLYDTRDNSINLIKNWNYNIMKYVNSRWKFSDLNKKDPTGFHFDKNSNFLKLPKSANLEGYEEETDILMDYNNNIHFIEQGQKIIDIFTNEI